jgi:CHAT domain-containing protein/Tfp pilus assembly protein PilF
VAELLKEGERLLDAGENQRSWETYQRAKDQAARTGDRSGEIAALTGMGDADPPRTDGKAALSAFEQALALARGKNVDSIRAHRDLRQGFRALDQGDLPQAETRFNSALAAAERSGDRRMQAASLHGLGHVAIRRSEPPRAGERYQSALHIATTIGYRFVMVRAERGLGNVEQHLGHMDEALRHYQASLALARAISNRRFIEGTLNAIGSVYVDQNDYGKAFHYLQEALRTGTDDPRETGYLLNNLGIVAGQTNAELGASYFQQCLRIAQQAGDDDLAMSTSNNLGTLAQREGEAKRSLEYFTQALHIAEKANKMQAIAGDWFNLATTYQMQNRLDLASHAYDQSLIAAQSTGNKALVGQTLSGLADLHFLRRDFSTAAKLAKRAATNALEAGDRQIFWSARTTAGDALRALGRPAAARKVYGDAIATVEEVRDLGAGGPLGREGYLESRIKPYQGMIELAADQGDTAEALQQAERAKGRTLNDVLQNGRIDLASSLTPQERATEQRLRERLSALNGEILRARSQGGAAAEIERRREQARRDLEAFNLNLYSARSGLRLRRADLPAWTLAAARPLLAGGNTALIEYAVLEDRTYLWTVTAGSASAPITVHLHRLPVGSAELARQVEAFRRQLAARDLDFQRSARRLYDLLLAPAAPELKGKTSLCIVPDGALWDLPFQALQTSGSEILLERHALFYAPSLGFLAEMTARRTRPPSPPTLLAVGNPALAVDTVGLVAPLRGAALARLPEAEREVRSLAGLYGPARSAVYTGPQASEEQVKANAGKFRVLHFATHAFLDDRTPLYSSLLLAQGAPARREDGLLEAWEILGLHLDADLVVLSACQTARGRPRAGEGMIGLSWALAAAGSSATLASQWEVDSASTGELMVAFHREWLGGASKAEALRRAALAVRGQERYRHPFYWAPFVLVGHGG